MDLHEQYGRLKLKYPDAILLFRVGDFYEALGEDAKVVSKDLDIPLSDSVVERTELNISFPYHSLDTHLRTLVKKGNRVAICDPL